MLHLLGPGMRRPHRRPERALARYERAIARQAALIRRGSYRRLADLTSRMAGYIHCTPAPLDEFLRKADR